MTNARKLLPFTLLALAACSGGDVSNTFGLNKSAPDEFVVVSRPPLVVPPEFQLLPPRPGEESPHAVSTEQQARKLLLGTDGTGDGGTMTYEEFMNTPGETPMVETAVMPVVSGDAPSPSTSSFLRRLGADEADPNIRQELRQEVVKPPKKKEAGSLYEEMLGDEQQETIVDPTKESERLRTNKDEGKPVTDGDTPTKDETPKSVLDRVF